MTDTLMGVSPPSQPAAAGDAEDRELSPAELGHLGYDTESVSTVFDRMPLQELAPFRPSTACWAAVEDLVRRARQAGVALTGPDGLLKAMTKTVIEAALEEEMALW